MQPKSSVPVKDHLSNLMKSMDSSRYAKEQKEKEKRARLAKQFREAGKDKNQSINIQPTPSHFQPQTEFETPPFQETSNDKPWSLSHVKEDLFSQSPEPSFANKEMDQDNASKKLQEILRAQSREIMEEQEKHRELEMSLFQSQDEISFLRKTNIHLREERNKVRNELNYIQKQMEESENTKKRKKPSWDTEPPETSDDEERTFFKPQKRPRSPSPYLPEQTPIPLPSGAPISLPPTLPKDSFLLSGFKSCAVSLGWIVGAAALGGAKILLEQKLREGARSVAQTSTSPHFPPPDPSPIEHHFSQVPCTIHETNFSSKHMDLFK